MAIGFLGQVLSNTYCENMNYNFEITALTRNKSKAQKIINLRDLKIKWIEDDILDLKPITTNYDIFFFI